MPERKRYPESKNRKDDKEGLSRRELLMGHLLSFKSALILLMAGGVVTLMLTGNSDKENEDVPGSRKVGRMPPLPRHPNRPPEKYLETVITGIGDEIHLTELDCPAGKCVVMRSFGDNVPTGVKLTKAQYREALQEKLQGLLPFTKNDDSQLLSQIRPKDKWAKADPQHFNCHTYSFHELGLTPNDWIDARAQPPTIRQAPVEVLIKSYCTQIASGKDIAVVLENPPPGGYKTGDIISYENVQPDGSIIYPHSGRLEPGGKFHYWVVAKEGSLPVMRTPVFTSAIQRQHIGERDPNMKYNRITVYRLKSRKKDR